MKRIPANCIHPNPMQPRRNFDEEALRELAASIAAQGLIQPIKVMPHPERPGEWMLVDDGERRLRAMRDILGWKELEVGRHVVVVEDGLSEADRLARAIAANLQRQDLDPIESARALQRLHDMGWSDEEIARHLGKSRSWVANRRRLLQLPEKVQDMVARGELSERKARALLTWLKYRNDVPDDLVDSLASSNDPHKVVWWRLLDRGRQLPWSPEQGFSDLPDRFHQGPCRTCRYYAARDERHYCLAPSKRCFSARHRAWVAMELARVSAETGIPVARPEEKARYFASWDERYRWIQEVREALERGRRPPEHLRLLPVRVPWHQVPIQGFGEVVTLGSVREEREDMESLYRQEQRVQGEVARALVPIVRALAERIHRTLKPETQVWLRRMTEVAYFPTTETLRHLPSNVVDEIKEDPLLHLALALVTPLVRTWEAPEEARRDVRALRRWLWRRTYENLAALQAEDLMPKEVTK